MFTRKNKKTITNEFIKAYKDLNIKFLNAIDDFKSGKRTKEGIVSAMDSILSVDKDIFITNDLDLKAKNKIYEAVLNKRKL